MTPLPAGMTPALPSRYLRRALLWLVVTTAVYLLMNGAQVFETAVIVPSWTAAPPASLSLFHGDHRLDFKAFWITLHTLHELTFLAACVACWKIKPIRRALLVLLVVHLGVRAWTLAYFAPTIIAFQQLAPSAAVDPALVERAALWRNLNYLRVGVFMAVSLAFLPLIGRLAALLARRDAVGG